VPTRVTQFNYRFTTFAGHGGHINPQLGAVTKDRYICNLLPKVKPVSSRMSRSPQVVKPSRLGHCPLTRKGLSPCATTSFDANAAADLNARIRSCNLGESDTIFRTRIISDPMRSIRLWWLFWRLTGLLSGHPSRQHRKN
jgi:hypothetical protein